VTASWPGLILIGCWDLIRRDVQHLNGCECSVIRGALSIHSLALLFELLGLFELWLFICLFPFTFTHILTHPYITNITDELTYTVNLNLV